uniref:Uncharacterized protein n=1 Tax=Oryza meridionalis TaxID=40149 RepID=A0A0E0DAR1_9ORYZ
MRGETNQIKKQTEFFAALDLRLNASSAGASCCLGSPPCPPPVRRARAAGAPPRHRRTSVPGTLGGGKEGKEEKGLPFSPEEESGGGASHRRREARRRPLLVAAFARERQRRIGRGKFPDLERSGSFPWGFPVDWAGKSLPRGLPNGLEIIPVAISPAGLSPRE